MGVSHDPLLSRGYSFGQEWQYGLGGFQLAL